MLQLTDLPAIADVAGPRWQAVYQALASSIRAGDWAVGTRLPAEGEVAAHYALNRHTVRRAMGLLAVDGLVVARPGRGTLVSGGPPQQVPLHPGTDLTAAFAASLEGFERRVSARDSLRAGTDRARQLGCGETDALKQTEFRILGAGLTVALCRYTRIDDRLPAFDDRLIATPSAVAALRHAGVEEVRRGDLRFGAALPDAREASLLQIAPSRPLLLVEGVLADGAGAPWLLETALLVSDRVRLSVPGGSDTAS
ncbi:MAG: GntR family transcriptional regulator [Devosiaceae bacterium]|nr:GntR family transcriptional regulator [Devosiaceae bacterium MH13]